MFEAAINDLRSRAKNAKNMSRIVFVIFVLLSGSAFLIVFSNVIASTNVKPSVAMANELEKALKGVDDAYEMFSSNVAATQSVSGEIGTSQIDSYNKEDKAPKAKAKDESSAKTEAHGTVSSMSLGGLWPLGSSAAYLWDEYIDYSKGKAVTGSIVTVIYSMLSTFILIYLMQVTLTFTRYYAQLAELYESQAFALVASNGDVPVAVEIIKNFSSRDISLGKFPASMYEKILELATKSTDKK